MSTTHPITGPQVKFAYALTLKNPWAHLIAHYGKDVENRTWMPHEGVDWLLIHAGQSWDRTAPFNGDLGDPHTGAIVATATLLFACNSSLRSDTVTCDCGEWAMPGQCHWKLGNVWALPEPVPALGRQGLWTPSPTQLARVHGQLPAPAEPGTTETEGPR